MLDELWRARWGILFVFAFAGLMALAVSKGPRTGLEDCEANGGHIVIPRLDERQAQPTRHKKSPSLICKDKAS
jgi:hypothetical protein